MSLSASNFTTSAGEPSPRTEAYLPGPSNSIDARQIVVWKVLGTNGRSRLLLHKCCYLVQRMDRSIYEGIEQVVWKKVFEEQATGSSVAEVEAAARAALALG